MRYFTTIVLALCLATLLIAAGFPGVASAEDFSVVRPGGRGGNWEFILPLIYAESATINGQGGSSVNVNSDWGFGFGFGYHFNDHFELSGLFNWSYRSYEATIVQTDRFQRKYNNYMDSSTIGLNGTYYILNGNISPFISAGIGYTYVDTNIPTGVGSTTCYWDPWWGYVCGNYAPTKTEDDITYSAGLGVRFDLSRQFALQASYNKTWMDINRAVGTPDFNLWRLDFVFRM